MKKLLFIDYALSKKLARGRKSVNLVEAALYLYSCRLLFFGLTIISFIIYIQPYRLSSNFVTTLSFIWGAFVFYGIKKPLMRKIAKEKYSNQCKQHRSEIQPNVNFDLDRS